MKSIYTGLLVLLIGCSTPTKNFPPASSSIEAGRNYVEACLQGDFEKTKDLILKLTYHLDETEKSYNKVYEEFKKRING